MEAKKKFEVILSRKAKKDEVRLFQAGLQDQTEKLLFQLQSDPFLPPYEKLVGDLNGYYSRRINIKHRLVYHVSEEEKIVKVDRMWSHYE